MFKFKIGIFLSCLNDFRNIKTDVLRKKNGKCRYDHDRRITLRLQQTENNNIRVF